MREAISVRGIENLSEEQKKLVDKLLEEYYNRIQRQLKNITSLEVYIKEYKIVGKENKEKKFSIHIRVMSSTKNFEGDASDWDLAKTLHKALNKIMNEIEHRFHPSEQHSSIRRPQKERPR